MRLTDFSSQFDGVVIMFDVYKSFGIVKYVYAKTACL